MSAARFSGPRWAPLAALPVAVAVARAWRRRQGERERAPEDGQAGAAPGGAEERFRSLVRNASDVIAVLGADGAVRYVSPAVERVLGHRPEDLVGEDASCYVHPDDLWAVLGACAEGLGSPGTAFGPVEFRFRHADGSWRHFEGIGTDLLDDPLVGGAVVNARDVTERVKTGEELRKSEASLAEAQRIARVGSWEYDVERDRARWSDEMYRIFGLAPQSFVPTYKTFLASAHPDDRGRLRGAVREALYRDGRGAVEYRVVRPGGGARVVHARYEVARDGDGSPVRMAGTVQDVTEQREGEERYRALVERVPPVIYVQEPEPEKVATYDVRYMSPRVEDVLGHHPSRFEEDPAFWNSITHPEDLGRVIAEEARTDETGEPFSMEYRVRRADGGWAWVRDEAVLVRDRDGGRPLYWQGALSDVTERKALEERLGHLALHDPLTGLPNRALLADRLGQALARAGRKGSEVAVLFADLDNFKVVNDSLGHKAGDGLLVAVAGRLRGLLRPGDTVARLGGDEFVFLLEDAGAGVAARVAERVAGALARPFALGGREVFATASVGVALGGPDPRKRPEDLLRDADLAMRRAKEAGKARHAVFEEGMDARALERLELEGALRRAVERGEFVVRYQPKVSLADGEVVGFEALVRWERPGRGLVPPDAFVPLAEETGLIVAIGEAVLREACRQAKGWRERFPQGPPLAVAVNLSARQFRDPGLAGKVARVLEETGLGPDGLDLEITESAAMGDAPAAVATLRELKALGLRIAIDDFGTGYSSLSYLKRLPVDYLKIDRSFVAGLGKDAGDETIVSAVVGLARAMGLGVVAEGVETEEQLAHLREMGCDVVQGYLLAGPMPGGAVPARLTARPAAREASRARPPEVSSV